MVAQDAAKESARELLHLTTECRKPLVSSLQGRDVAVMPDGLSAVLLEVSEELIDSLGLDAVLKVERGQHTDSFEVEGL